MRCCWAFADLVISVGNLIINSYKEQLPDEALDIWEDLNMIIAVYQIGRLGLQAIKKGKDIVKKLRTYMTTLKLSKEERKAMELILKSYDEILELGEDINKASVERLREIKNTIKADTRLSSAERAQIVDDLDVRIKEKITQEELANKTTELEKKLNEEWEKKKSDNIKKDNISAEEEIYKFGDYYDDEIIKGFRQMVLDLKLNEKFPYLKVDELTAIRAYTSDSARNGKKIYFTLNEQLRMGKLDKFNKVLHNLLKSALEKMPKYEGNSLYRGIHGKEAIQASKWKKGDKIFFKDYKSTSTNLQKAALGFGEDIFLEMRGANGTDICRIACIPDELEILLFSGQEFKVVDIENNFQIYNVDYSTHTPFTKIILQAL